MSRILIAVIGALLFSACSSQTSGIPKSPRGLGLEPISFEIPAAERWELKNGMVVHYYFDDELPQMRARLYLPGGSLFDPQESPGLASAVGAQMREGGIPGFAPDKLDQHLDTLAASIESAYGEEYGSVSCFSLIEDFEHVFGLFNEVIRNPQFDAKRFALWKKLSAEGITRRKDNPGTMAGMSFNRLLFGVGSAYYLPVSVPSLERLNADRLREFHRRFVRPNGSHLAITGAMPRQEVEALVEKTFGDWLPVLGAIPELPDLVEQAPAGLYVLERKFDQTTVILGHRGPPRYPPDLFEMFVYNNLFGHGGFSATLFQEIRTRLGLVYSIYGSLVPAAKQGTFQIMLQTRNEAVQQALTETIRLTRESTGQAPEATRFSEALSSAERSFVFRFAEPSSIVDRRPMLKILGYPDDYDATYLSRLRGVTPELVQQTAARWVKPDELIIVVVGGVSADELAKTSGLPVYRLEFDTEPRIVGPVMSAK